MRTGQLEGAQKKVTTQSVEAVINSRYWVNISFCDFVQLPVFDTESLNSVFFWLALWGMTRLHWLVWSSLIQGPLQEYRNTGMQEGWTSCIQHRISQSHFSSDYTMGDNQSPLADVIIPHSRSLTCLPTEPSSVPIWSGFGRLVVSPPWVGCFVPPEWLNPDPGRIAKYRAISVYQIGRWYWCIWVWYPPMASS